MTANIKVVVLAGLFFGLGLVVGSQRNAFSPLSPQTDAAIIPEESEGSALRVEPSVEGPAANRKPASSSSARKQKNASQQVKRRPAKAQPPVTPLADAPVKAMGHKPTASVTTDKRSSQSGFEIVDIDSKVTESNNVWWRFAWKLTLRNRSSATLVVDATIEFQDSDGFVIDEDREYSLVLSAGETKTFTGFDLINAETASKVSQLSVKVSRQ